MARRHKVAYRWVLTETQLGGPPGSPGLIDLTVAAGEEQTKRKAREAAERAKLPGMRVYSVVCTNAWARFYLYGNEIRSC